MSDVEPVDPLEALALAVQEFANVVADGPELVDNAIVIWEAVSFDEDGTAQRCIRYAVPTPNFTMSGTLGLLRAGDHYIRRDVLPTGHHLDD
jgi:hypothetical protein